MQTRCLESRRKLLINNNILEPRSLLQFGAGGRHAPLDHLGRILAAGVHALAQRFERRRRDEDADRVGEQALHLGGALPVDLEHDVDAGERCAGQIQTREVP